MAKKQTAKFRDLALGTRFRYLPEQLRDNAQVFVILENYGYGMIATWDGPTKASTRVMSFADSLEDAESWEVEVLDKMAGPTDGD